MIPLARKGKGQVVLAHEEAILGLSIDGKLVATVGERQVVSINNDKYISTLRPLVGSYIMLKERGGRLISVRRLT